MNKIFQVYLPGYYRSYKQDSLAVVQSQLNVMKGLGCKGIWLIGLWDSDWSDIGFSIKDYIVNPLFGSREDLLSLIEEAHNLNLEIGCDVVPNHASTESALVYGTDGKTINIVSKEDAERLTKNGVPSFFGKNAYSKIKTKKFGEVWARTKFADNHQVDLNWLSIVVRYYFKNIFDYINELGFDFVRVDCAEMLLEETSLAMPNNPFACLESEGSVRAILDVSGHTKLFLECFNPEIIRCDFGDNVYITDCSFVKDFGETTWDDFEKRTLKYVNFSNYVPILGGHDQKPFANRFGETFQNNMLEDFNFDYIFTDMATELGFKNSKIMPTSEDAEYDADLYNENQRWKSRVPIEDIYL